MDRYRETFNTWNKVADMYNEKFMDMDLYNETYDYICETVAKENAKLLEIGCGPGNITKYLLSNRPDFDILGIDIAPKMIEHARKNNPTARFEMMDTRNIGELQTKFDGIVCGFCLPFLSEQEAAKLIADCHNLLSQNGLLYLSFVEGDPAQSGFKEGQPGNRVYFYFHSLDQLNNLLSQNGFTNLQTTKVDFERGKDEKEEHTILTGIAI